MSDRVEALVRSLGLARQPEGGFYREIYRASARVEPADGRGPRDALTSIHFHSSGRRAAEAAWCARPEARALL